MEGVLKELPEELLLPKEGGVEGLLTPPERGLKDLLPTAEGALIVGGLKELTEGLLPLVDGGVKDLSPPPEGALVEAPLVRPSKLLCWLDALSPEPRIPASPRFPNVADGPSEPLAEPLARLLKAAPLFSLLAE